MVLVAPDHIESGSGRLLQMRTAAQQGAISGKYLFNEHDIVYSKIRPYLRKAVLVGFRGLCSADMYPLTPARDVDPGYMLAVLLDERFSRFAESVSVRSGIPKINREELAEFRVPLPPYAEQRMIGQALSDVDALIAALQRLISKKHDIKDGAMQQLLTGSTRLPGFAGEWREERLGDFLRFKNGLNKAKAFFGHGTPIVNYMDVLKNGGLMLRDVKGLVAVSQDEAQSYSARPGDIFFTRTSETVEEIGLTSVLLERIPNAVFSGFVLRARPTRDVLDTAFKQYCFRSRAVRMQIIASASYTTRALTNGRSLSRVKLQVPTRPEQEAIAAVLSDMDAEIDALRERLAKTEDIKQGMMQELLSGRTRLVTEESAA
jgi:type I restriction enzyme S subunit